MAEQAQYVYLIGSSESPLVKIGTAQDVAARLRTLQNSSPTPLRLLWQTEGGRGLEAALHEQFAEYRQHGEWFNLQDRDAVSVVSAAAERLAADVAVRDARKRPAYLRPGEDDGALGSMMVVLVWGIGPRGSARAATDACPRGSGRRALRVDPTRRSSRQDADPPR